MWLSLTAFFAVCVFLVDSLNNRELDLKFQLRTPGEWEKEWHQERYSRCRDSISRHLRWACEKDIYKLKRSEARDIFAIKKFENTITGFEQPSEEHENQNIQAFQNLDETSSDQDEQIEKYPWLDQKWAMGMLRSKRGASKRSGVITQECCSSKGCTWEEYAEYCTQNNRKVTHKRYDYVSDY